jgi:hypothetical protein
MNITFLWEVVVDHSLIEASVLYRETVKVYLTFHAVRLWNLADINSKRPFYK